MRKIVLLMALSSALAVANTASANVAWSVASQDLMEHGGGCRKSSPPGQCCHMDNRVGIVHCH